jgi:glycosyltransferase involved in cell wall biosynthesis
VSREAISGTKGRIGIAPARFGPGISGGAEIVLAEMATGLQARGWEVEILTTCARDGYSWRNEIEPGVTTEDGLLVRRFPAVVSTPGAERAAVEQAMQAGIRPSLPEQQRWMNDGVRMPEMYHYLLDHAGDYQTLVFAPYPFWMAFACSQIAPERSVLLTCLHDEPYAYLELFEPVFTGVAGLLFMSEPEHQLAHRIHPGLARHDLVGCSVGSRPDTEYDPDRFRARYGIKDPFVLYLGRREGAKGWPDLMRSFAAATARLNLPLLLVTAGGGDPDVPSELTDRVVDLGFITDQDRDDALAAAVALVQPSRYEAFSRTVMESWLAGTLVIANGSCEVLAWHCERSGAGLTYNDEAELEECLAFVAEAPEAAAAVAAPGRQYVLDNYDRDAVIDRIETALLRWTGTADPADAGGPAA